MKTNNWIYFGVFIDEKAKHLNEIAIEKQGMDIPYNWKMFNHHMTIAFNNKTEDAQNLYDVYKHTFGKTITITVDGIGVSDDAIAVRIRFNDPIANEIPHITIATPQTGKPVNSNYITKWYDIEPYDITGTLNEFTK
jgi:2'-5' RNA ligase